MSRVEGNRSKIRRPTLSKSFVGSMDEHDVFRAYMHSLEGENDDETNTACNPAVRARLRSIAGINSECKR